MKLPNLKMPIAALAVLASMILTPNGAAESPPAQACDGVVQPKHFAPDSYYEVIHDSDATISQAVAAAVGFSCKPCPTGGECNGYVAGAVVYKRGGFVELPYGEGESFWIIDFEDGGQIQVLCEC